MATDCGLRVESSSPRSSSSGAPLTLQGNLDYYSLSALSAREKLGRKEGGPLDGELRMWLRALPRRADLLLGQNTYMTLDNMILRCLLGDQPDEALQKIADDDWISDSEGSAAAPFGGLSDVQLRKALFTLADVWCDSIEETEYEQFLHTLQVKVLTASHLEKLARAAAEDDRELKLAQSAQAKGRLVKSIRHVITALVVTEGFRDAVVRVDLKKTPTAGSLLDNLYEERKGYARAGARRDDLKVSYRGRTVADDERLAKLGLANGATLHVVLLPPLSPVDAHALPAHDDGRKKVLYADATVQTDPNIEEYSSSFSPISPPQKVSSASRSVEKRPEASSGRQGAVPAIWKAAESSTLGTPRRWPKSPPRHFGVSSLRVEDTMISRAFSRVRSGGVPFPQPMLVDLLENGDIDRTAVLAHLRASPPKVDGMRTSRSPRRMAPEEILKSERFARRKISELPDEEKLARDRFLADYCSFVKFAKGEAEKLEATRREGHREKLGRLDLRRLETDLVEVHKSLTAR